MHKQHACKHTTTCSTAQGWHLSRHLLPSLPSGGGGGFWPELGNTCLWHHSPFAWCSHTGGITRDDPTFIWIGPLSGYLAGGGSYHNALTAFLHTLWHTAGNLTRHYKTFWLACSLHCLHFVNSHFPFNPQVLSLSSLKDLHILVFFLVPCKSYFSLPGPVCTCVCPID